MSSIAFLMGVIIGLLVWVIIRLTAIRNELRNLNMGRIDRYLREFEKRR